MRKRFTLSITFMLAALAVSADNIEFQFNGKKVNEGDTVTINATVDSYVDGGETVIVGIQAASNANGNNLQLCNVGGKSVKVNGKVTVEKNNANASIQWCFGGTCMMLKGDSLVRTITSEKDTKKNMEIDANFTIEGNCLAKFYCTTLGAETHTFYINFVYNTTTDVRTAALQQPKVSFNGGSLNYTFKNYGLHSLNVYSAQGALVLKRNLESSGSVAFNQLPKGVYICAITENGQRVAVRKINVE
jgi:hypothetical protein